MNSIKMFSPPGQLTNSNKKESTKKTEEPVKDSRDPKMLEAAQSFENQFIRQMISEMRKTVPKDELTGDSMADDIFREQLDDQYADMWTNQGGIGLADMIYDKLYDQYGPQSKEVSKLPGTFIKLPNTQHQQGGPAGVQGSTQTKTLSPAPLHAHNSPSLGVDSGKPKDILSEADKRLFLLKMSPEGFTMKSKEPLPEKVGLMSPFSGVVLQAASLEDGRQMLVVRHDQGLVTRFVHSGANRVKNDMRVAAGEIIAELPPSKNGESANVVFELRQTAKTE